jgi:hypothetical protein
MALQDVAGTSMMISESRNLRVFPGLFDALGDYVNRYGAAVVAVTAVHFGLWSWATLLVVTACAITSFFTSNFATGKASMILPKDRMEKITMRDFFHRLFNSFGKEAGDG